MTTVDDLLAPLVELTQSHGLQPLSAHPGDDDSPAHLIFAEPHDALEFLLHTAHHGGYSFGDQVAVTIVPPQGAGAHGKVSWLSVFTPDITHIWASADREDHERTL